MTITSNNKTTQSYTTKDGSIIRERVHPNQHHNKNQSLAEAIIPPGTETHLHCHPLSEEIYFILQGKGEMTLAEQQFSVQAGDSIVIAPGQPHKLNNPFTEELRLLCCCSPAYSHEDTLLL